MTDLNEMFCGWLNRVDAKIEYTTRCDHATVATWRAFFDMGMSESEAIEDAKQMYVEQADKIERRSEWSPCVTSIGTDHDGVEFD